MFPIEYYPPPPNMRDSEQRMSQQDRPSTTYMSSQLTAHVYAQSQPFMHLPQRQATHPSPPGESSRLPSFQVTQPTPTKGRKFRHSNTNASTPGENLFIPSPTWQIGLLSSPDDGGNGTLEANIEPSSILAPIASGSRSRPRSPESKARKDSLSELERQAEIRQAEIMAEKQARMREKGRERQRRKRERDKKAREAAAAAMNCTKGTPTHLSSNASNNLNINMPSPESSGYSSLATASYFSISPTHPLALSVGSASVSGESSPNTLFSPAISTPGTGYSIDGMTVSGLNPGLELTGNANRRSRIARASSGSIPTNSTTLKVSSTTGLPAPQGDKAASPSPPYKRRKSEPKPMLFRQPADNIFGAGLNFVEQLKERPKPHRTQSDGFMLVGEANKTASSRSPTPPPVPTLPDEYRQRSTAVPAHDLQLSPASVEASYFASTMILSMCRSELPDVKRSKERLGLGDAEIESMKEGLATFYDKWALEREMSKISLDNPESGNIGPESSVENRSVGSTIYSPSRVPASFLTPASGNATQHDIQAPATLPLSLPAQLKSPLATQSHGRQRSLSALSVITRPNTVRWQPETPTTQSAKSLLASKDDAGSPVTSTIHTPSTGHGAFPVLDNLMSLKSQHYRPATDPTGSKSYTIFNRAQVNEMSSGEVWDQIISETRSTDLPDSPLLSTGQSEHISVGMSHATSVTHPRCNVVAESNISGADNNSSSQLERHRSFPGHYRTPSGPRSSGLKSAQGIPFTPPTPLDARGQGQENYSADESLADPLFYSGVFGGPPLQVLDQRQIGQPQTQTHSQDLLQQPQTLFDYLPVSDFSLPHQSTSRTQTPQPPFP
ncbi:hypothetical protein AYX14_00995 [Cryptococcus neoformans]|nr:hypothetical protein AYX15_00088 [Cryptococcus neoformans var. grubii]OWZ73455.1 hypothetical protein AYX14_00995 [Cryptococcus neoformans var. grubii]